MEYNQNFGKKSSLPSKLNRSEKLVIFILSVIFGICTYYYSIGWFFNSEITGFFYSLINFILGLPVAIVSFPIYELLSFVKVEEGTGLGVGILLALSSPVYSFVFWFIVFYCVARLSKKYINSPQSLLKTTSVPVLFTLIFVMGLLSYNPTLVKFHKTSGDFGFNPDGKIIAVTPQPARVGDLIKVTISGFTHDGYSYIYLIKYNPDGSYVRRAALWVGKIADQNSISFSLQGKNCIDKVDLKSCDAGEIVDTIPGQYKLRLQSPGDNILLESDFTIVQ